MSLDGLLALLVLVVTLAAGAGCVAAAVRAGRRRDVDDGLTWVRCGWVLSAFGLVVLCLLLEQAPTATINSDPEDCGPAVVGVIAGTGNDPECVAPVRHQVEWAGGVGGAIVLGGAALVAANRRPRRDVMASRTGAGTAQAR